MTATYRKISRGLYGTGKIRSIYADEDTGCHYLGRCECKTVEMVIDNYTDRDGWYQRWVCEHGHFSDILGEWYPTLRAAKASITR